MGIGFILRVACVVVCLFVCLFDTVLYICLVLSFRILNLYVCLSIDGFVGRAVRMGLRVKAYVYHGCSRVRILLDFTLFLLFYCALFESRSWASCTVLYFVHFILFLSNSRFSIVLTPCVDT